MRPRYGRRLPLTHEQGLLLSKASWLVPGTTVVLAMFIHLLSGPRAIPFFISETDYPGLQDHVFTIGLSAAGLLQMTYAWHLYHTLDAERPSLWFGATLVGILAAINTILLSNFDMYGFINTHIATATLAFGGGILWIFLAQWALGSCTHIDGQRLRNLGFGMAFTGFVVMVTSFLLAVNSFDSAGMTTEAVLNEAQAGIVVAAPAEYVLVGGLLVCLASFRHELQHQGQGKSHEQQDENPQ